MLHLITGAGTGTEHPDTSNMTMREYECRQVTPGNGAYGHALMYSYALLCADGGWHRWAGNSPIAEPMRPCTFKLICPNRAARAPEC